MSLEIRQTGCCGMREINNLSHETNPEGALNAFLRALQKGDGPTFPDGTITRIPAINFSLVMFSGVVERVRRDHASDRPDNYGENFASLITRENLGEVVVSTPVVNPRTNNTIRAWIWSVNRPNLASYAERNGHNEIRRVTPNTTSGAPGAPIYYNAQTYQAYHGNGPIRNIVDHHYEEIRRNAQRRLDDFAVAYINDPRNRPLNHQEYLLEIGQERYRLTREIEQERNILRGTNPH